MRTTSVYVNDSGLQSENCLGPFTLIRCRLCVPACVPACQSVTFNHAHGLWPVLILLLPLMISVPRSVRHTFTLPSFPQQIVAKCRVCLFLYILSFAVPAHVTLAYLVLQRLLVYCFSCCLSDNQSTHKQFRVCCSPPD